MKQRVITLLVVALMFLSMHTSIAYAAIDDLPAEGTYFYYNSNMTETEKVNITKTVYRYAYELLAYFDIVQDDAFEAEETATREFAAQVFGLMKARTIVEAKSAPFRDVPMSNAYVNAIETAKQSGVVKGDSDGKFRPGAEILISEAMEMAMCVLGYDAAPEKLMSTWVVTGIKNGLMKGIDGSKETLTNGELLIMALNTLESQKYDSDSYVLENGEFYPVFDQGDKTNILLKDFGVQLERGVVTSVGAYSLLASNDFAKNEMEINRKKYSTISLPDTNLFGKSVYAYIDTVRDNGTVITVWEDERYNNVISLAADSCEFLSGQSVRYYDETGRSVTAKIDGNALAVYNLETGVSVGQAMAQKLTEKANDVVLIDNDGDEQIDVVLLSEYDYRVVDNVSSTGVIYFKYGKTRIDIADIEFMEMNGNEVELASLKNGDVAMVLSTKRTGSEKYTILFARNVASGVLEKIDTNSGRLEFSIDGENYVASEFYEEYYTEGKIAASEVRPSVGDKATFYIAADGKIVASFIGNTDWNYAYLVACKKKSGLNDIVHIKLFTQGMFVFEEYTIDKEIELYTWPELNSSFNIEPKAKPGDVYNALVNGSTYKTEMVAYKVNKEGNLVSLATEYSGEMGAKPFVSSYPLVKNYKTGETMSDGSISNWLYMRVLGTLYNVSDVPTGIQAPPYGSNRSDEIFYGKWSHKADEQFATDNTLGRSLAIYNADSCGNAGLLLYKPEPGATGGVGTVVDTYAAPVLVSKKVVTVNDDGEQVTRIYYPSSTATVSADFSPNVTFSFVEQNSSDYYGKPALPTDVDEGDIIQWEEDSYGRIVTVRILFKANNRGAYRTQWGSTTIGTANEKYFNSSLVVSWGKIMDKQGKAVIQNLSPTGLDEEQYNYPMFFNGNRNSVHSGGTVYTLWDSVRKEAKIVSLDEVQIGDEMFIVSDYNVSYRGFIYR